MGALCCKSAPEPELTDERTLLLSNDQNNDSQSNSKITYDDLVTLEIDRMKEDDLLQKITLQTANEMINVSNQASSNNILPKRSAKSYKQIVLDFDQNIDMSKYMPKILVSNAINQVQSTNNENILSTNVEEANAFILGLINSEHDQKDLELVGAAANHVAKTMSEFSLQYVGEVFIPFDSFEQNG
ncbi:hypothetical protein BB558_000838 [Smittium angustum]|uniref:Uncharacterized protein n=1 Tax=Smittium angustum TaxID=133377 RepID=A0A2U1JDA1_SMIAN|nr:hypothetical protein BB558_007333 [Smittium angustum]PWA02994.1 hypothetical protein BB558_000838 [Smittium angustum]